MKKKRGNHFISLFLCLFLVLNTFSGVTTVRAKDKTSKASAVNEEKKDTDYSKLIKQGEEKTKEKSKFGPYDNSSGTSKHAYDPVKGAQDEKLKDKKIEYRNDRILIKVEEKSSLFGLVKSTADVKNYKKYGVKSLEKLKSSKSSKKGLLQGSSSETNWYRAYVNDGTDIAKTVESISNEGNVVTAEPDYIRKVSDITIPTSTTDPDMTEQWYLDKINVKEAWNYLASKGINPGGSRDVIVAVIDTGVDYKHADLAANIWTNSGEIAGNGIDDDNDGYIDDVHGVCTVGDQYSGDSGDPMDDNGHGTHVAGIIAGQANNNLGISGIAYNVQIMPIKAAQSSGILTSSDIAQAINYASSKGADVINMSFGGYGEDTIEQDALANAFGQSVLVASSGNDGIPNETIDGIQGRPLYPAAYPWVLGVMAENQTPAANGDNLAAFSNWDAKSENSLEYEIMAPGSQILSTLPNNQYAKWSGTSMAAPVVSAVAALVRSAFTDKNEYNSRFIMGQIVSTGPVKQGITYDDKEPSESYHELNALQALTNTPKPNVSYLEHYIFDTKTVSDTNNGDGIIDAGETVDLAMVLKNHWGKADNVTVTLNTNSAAGIADPYVTFLDGTNTVNFGAIGNFGTDDNGLIYDSQGAITGVNSPFKIKIADNTPNDHVIPINVTITAKNGFDANDTTVYTTTTGFTLTTRNGEILPGEITSDMTLTKDKYWIIPNATVIDSGVTVNVEPGTQIQFWSSEPEDPYAEKAMAYLWVKGNLNVEGTADDPVQMFASGLFPGYEVKIFNKSSLNESCSEGSKVGNANIKYAKIMNPNISVDNIDHCWFSQDLTDCMYKRHLNSGTVYTESYYGAYVSANTISNSIFYKLGNHYDGQDYCLNIKGKSIGNLFDSCKYYMDEQTAENNVYLKNYKLNNGQYLTSKAQNFASSIDKDTAITTYPIVKDNNNGSSYFAVRPNAGFSSGYDEMQAIEKYAESLGGYIATINDQNENNFITSYINNNNLGSSFIGCKSFEYLHNPDWINGEMLTYNNWSEGQPNGVNYNGNNLNYGYITYINNSGSWYPYPINYYGLPYIIEVPGISNVTSITLDQSNLTLGAGGSTVKLNPTIMPLAADNKNITWTSSDSSVASVDSSGTVTPIKAGNAVITVTTEDGGYSASCNVTVVDIIHPTGVALNHHSINLSAGNTETLIASLQPENCTERNVTWTSSNESVATVDSNGNVKGLTTGTADITVTTLDGGYTDKCTVNVIVPVTGITLDQNFLRLIKDGANGKINAAVYPSDATIKNVSFSSSNQSVVTVDEAGNIVPVGTGTALITAVTEDGGYSSTCTVTVWDHQVDFVTTKVVGGDSHSLALNQDGTIWAWGNNGNGQLGDGTAVNKNTPIQVPGLSNVVKIAAGAYHSLAIKSDGTLWNWGSWGVGNSSVPIKVDGLSNIVDVAAGNYYTLALKSDGTVWAWGYNCGNLGDGSNEDRYSPVQVQNLTDVKAIYAICNSSFAIKNDGTIWAWGYNGNYNLGDGTNTNRNVPVKINIDNVKEIAVGSSLTAFLKNDGTIWGCGNSYINAQTLQPLYGVSGVKKISAGVGHLLALKEDGTIYSLGYNYYGQLGDGTTNSSYSFTQVLNLSGVQSIGSGYYHSFAIKSDNTIYSWGQNTSGQLGNLSTENSSIPTQTLFGILPDITAPTLLSTDPINGATGVNPDGSIVLNFNEEVKVGINFSTAALKDSSGNTLSLGVRSFNGTTLTLKPVNPLNEFSTYTLTLPGSSIKDVFNNNINDTITITFTTGANISYLSSFEGLKSLLTSSLASVNTINITPQNAAETAPVVKHDITADEVAAARTAFIDGGNLSTIKNNAILNTWWDPDVSHWMRFTSNDGTGQRYLANNYWGTTSDLLIGKALVDYNDFKTMEEIIYKPILTTPPATAYPFVSDVYVSTESTERASVVGAETIKVNVLFNRDMNQNVQPKVTFGPDMPVTDYTVNGVNGGWIDSRHWQGDFKISSMTGDGYQFFRVVGAQAADDPWLVTGDDSERFRFEIVTSGTESMNLQAAGEEGRIHLTWTQDDFDLLAGYDVYRSDTADGTYVKLNSTIIPSDQKYYDDTSVEPGKTYYYKFKVIKTDLSESDFSNVAMAAAFDTVPPVINHNIITGANAGMPLQIYADVTDNVKVTAVNLYYRKIGDVTYTKLTMNNTTDNVNRYFANIEGSNIVSPGIEYYIEATDGNSFTTCGSLLSPNKVVIADAPKITNISPISGPDTGAAAITITGSNFKTGAKVTLDGAAASDVTVIDSNQITAVTPAHYAGLADVAVTNSDGYSDTLLNGYTYIKEGVSVSIPNIQGNIGDIVRVPVNIADVTGLNAADLKIGYDSELLSVKGVSKGDITSGFTLSSNNDTPGVSTISMASPSQVSGNGVLAYVDFQVLSSAKTSCIISIDSISLNSGNIKTSNTNGNFNVALTHTVSGNVYYYNGGKAVAGVDLSLDGIKSYSNTTNINGNYSLSNVENGNYKLNASKSDEAVGITSYDASLILQNAVGSISLNSNQMTAADVNCDGRIDSSDASLILKKSAGLIGLPFTGAGKVWTFTPAEMNLTGVASNLYNNNFTAILIGDVSGNWTGAENTITSAGTAEFTLGYGKKAADGSYNLGLKLKMDEADLYSTDMVIKYNSSAIDSVTVINEDKLQNAGIAVNTSVPGEIRIAAASGTPINGSGTMINLNLHPASAGSINGLYTTAAIESSEVNEGLVSSKIFSYKDVNRDGNTDIIDLALAAQNYNQKISGDLTDVNEDGVVNLYDLIIISKP